MDSTRITLAARVLNAKRNFSRSLHNGPLQNEFDHVNGRLQNENAGDETALHDAQSLPRPSSSSANHSQRQNLGTPTTSLKPWMVEFSPPKLRVSVKLGSFSSRSNASLTFKQKLLVQQITRVNHAKEKSIEYMLQRSPVRRSANPNTLRGWMGLVEDRIQNAKAMGHFANLPGRGKPLKKDVQDANPFVTREEFYMNRIIKKNNATPPWIEMQLESDKAVTSFREMLQNSWVRRAARTLTLDGHFNLSRVEVDSLKQLRDIEWEDRERSFHDTVLQEVNSLIRKYNAIAPISTHRSYLERQSELDRVYHDQASAEAIIEKIKSSSGPPLERHEIDSSRAATHAGASAQDNKEANVISLREIFVQFWLAFRKK